MKRKVFVIIMIILFTYIPLNFAEENVLSNEYLKLYFDDIGNIRLSTKENKWLTYPDFTSYYTILISNEKYSSCVYNPSDADHNISDIDVEKSIIDDTSVQYNFIVEGLKVSILYILEKENLHFKIILKNIDTEAKKVGFRYLLDTQLDENDGAPLFFEGYGVCIKETLIENPSSKGWQAYDKWPNPTLVSYWSPVTLPCKIIFAHWPTATEYSWDYLEFNESRNFYTPGYIKSPKSDSCVLIYYCPTVINSGEEITIEFYYGLSEKINVYENIISLLNRIKSKLIKLVEDANITLRFLHDIINEVFDPETKDMLKALASFITAYVSREEIIESLSNPNLNYLKTLANQILRALKSDNNRVWAWVTRKLKYSGLVGILAFISIGASIAHKIKKTEILWSLMETSFTELISLNFLYDLKNRINSIFNILINNIAELYASLDKFKREYLAYLLENINTELNQILSFDRSILIIGSKYYNIQPLNIYMERILKLKERLSMYNTVNDVTLIVSTSTFAITKVLAPTILGTKAAAILAIIGLIAKLVGLCTEYIIYRNEMAIYKNYMNSLEASINIYASLEKTSLFFEKDKLKQFVSDIAIYPHGNVKIDNIKVVDEKVLLEYSVNLMSSINYDNSTFVYFRVINNDDGTTVYEDVMPYTNTIHNVVEVPIDLELFSDEYTFLIELWGDGVKLDWEVCSKKLGLLEDESHAETLAEDTISSGKEKVFNVEVSLSEGNFLMFYGGSEVDLHVYDSEGRHVGVNYDTGEIEIEIPNAKYSGNLANPEWVKLPKGSYEVSVVGVSGSTEYTLIFSEIPSRNPTIQVLPEAVNITLYRDMTSTSVTLLIFNMLSKENTTVNVLIGHVSNYIIPIREQLNLTVDGNSFTSLNIEFNISSLIKAGEYIIPVKIIHKNNITEIKIIFNIIVLGDINSDGLVNYKDLAIIASSYGSLIGDAKYIVNADLNADGIIDYKDLAILSANYGIG